MSTTTITNNLAQARFKGLVPILSTMNALVVGCGALGSHLITMLARMGPQSITCCDHDIITEENLGVQNFSYHDIGARKAHAICKNIDSTSMCGRAMSFAGFAKTSLYNREHMSFYSHVFMCVDRMSVRKEILGVLETLGYTGILVDGRLDANVGWIYACYGTPKWFARSMYSDEEVINVAQGCALQQTGYSAHVVAGIMVAQAMRFSQDLTLIPEKKGIDLNNMLFFTGDE